MEDRKITSFTDIKAWQESHKLAIDIYNCTSNFPAKEQYSLSAQLRRASVSVTTDIADGFGRSSNKNKEHFLTMASGSLYEVKSQLLLARDLKFINQKNFDEVAEQANLAHKLLNGLLRAHKKAGNPNV